MKLLRGRIVSTFELGFEHEIVCNYHSTFPTGVELEIVLDGKKELFRDRVHLGNTYKARFSIEGEKIGKVKIMHVGVVLIVVKINGVAVMEP
jgi:hypothetical protein